MYGLIAVLLLGLVDCMEPVIGDGWLMRVDTSRVELQPGDVVAVHIEGAGNVIGYWGGGERAALLHENPAHGALDLCRDASASSAPRYGRC